MLRILKFSVLLPVLVFGSVVSAQHVVVRLTDSVDSNAATSGQVFHGTVVAATKFNSGLAIPAGAVATLDLIDDPTDIHNKQIMLDSLQFNGQTVFVSQQNIGILVNESGEDFSMSEMMQMMNRGMTADGPHVVLPVGTTIRFGAYIDKNRAQIQASAPSPSQGGEPIVILDKAPNPADMDANKPYYYQGNGKVFQCTLLVNPFTKGVHCMPTNIRPPASASPGAGSHGSVAPEAASVSNGSPTRDPATFDVIGVRLYMTYDQVVQIVQKHFGVIAKPVNNLYSMSDDCEVNLKLHIALGYVSTQDAQNRSYLKYCSTDGTMMIFNFLPRQKLGPPILGSIVYHLYGGIADRQALYKAIKAKYGQATSCKKEQGVHDGTASVETEFCTWDRSRLASEPRDVPYAAQAASKEQLNVTAFASSHFYLNGASGVEIKDAYLGVRFQQFMDTHSTAKPVI